MQAPINKKSSLFFVLVILSLLMSRQVFAEPLNPEITTKKLQSIVDFLSAEKLAGRLTGTRGEKLATQYIADNFARLGLEPAGDHGTYFQVFDFSVSQKQGQLYKQQGRNVLARLRVGNSSGGDIVIGAHVDHLGHGEISGSRARANEKGMIHPGADDNASGVASMLLAASKAIQQKIVGNHDILFVAWSGEELGILGSSHFIKNKHKKVDVNINLDMVGRLQDQLMIQGVGSSVMWSTLITQANKRKAFKLQLQADPYLPTDSTAFYLQGIPSINFFTGAYDEYHSPRDKPETLNYAGLKNISEMLVDLVMVIEEQPNNLSFQAVKQTKNRSAGALKVYLGTIPDYASADVQGVRLSGVSKDSPADRVGLRQGDIVVKLARREVNDIYDYTAVLNELKVGKAVEMVVVRGEGRVVLNIVPRPRS